MELPIFEFEFDEATQGVFAISLVSQPAIDVQMMQFSKQEEEEEIWKMASEEKRILISPVLIPNQKIYRKNIQGEAGYVFASEMTIERLAQNFFKQGYNFNSTLEHETPIEGVYFFESWIVEDPKNDKSNALGFTDVVKGTWFVAMKIENDSVWNDFIKTGKVTGLSMDALLKTKKIETQKINKLEMEKETIDEIVRLAVEQIKADALVEPAKLAMELVISDTITYYVDSLELGSIVTYLSGLPLLASEFEYEGNEYYTDELGAIKEVKPVEVVEEVVIPEVEVELEVVEDPKDLKIAELEAKIKEMEGENVKLKSDIVFNESEIIKLKSETPASIGISNIPVEKKDLSKMTELEKYRYNKTI